MVAKGTPLPTKLKKDAILESIFEIRFDSEGLAEVFMGRMLDHPNWKAFKQRRLPAHDVPERLRQLDTNLKFAPTLEAIGVDGLSALRIGEHSVSFHRKLPYPGWNVFKPHLVNVVDSLFETTNMLTVSRLGLRYLNSLTSKDHGISSFADLDVDLKVSNQPISAGLNINFTSELQPQSRAVVRVATREFIEGQVPQDSIVFVDVDISTRDGFKTQDKAAVKDWIEMAHLEEKQEFFRLFTQAKIDSWRET